MRIILRNRFETWPFRVSKFNGLLNFVTSFLNFVLRIVRFSKGQVTKLFGRWRNRRKHRPTTHIRRLATIMGLGSEQRNNRFRAYQEPAMDLDDESCNQILLVPAEEMNHCLTKYGASREPPRDNSIFCPSDDHFGFFAQGREFASASTTHRYTEQEKRMLGEYESLEYLPSHSEVYKKYVQTYPRHHSWLRWLMMCFIGFTVGLIGFLLHQTIDRIGSFKWDLAKFYLKQYVEGNGSFVTVFVWVTGFSIGLVFLSASLVVVFRPQAASSGIPELMGFLNGTVVRHIFNIKTLIIKFLSCILCVAADMPVGPEGPMIHIGSLVGAGLSQFKSDTMKFKLPCFERFRNFEDRRDFISAGAAAGVASAFGAPSGGMLFSMEEVSSYWDVRLVGQIFCCATMASCTTALFNSAFSGFSYQGAFGAFKPEEFILFKVKDILSINFLTFIPAILLGVIGGVMGALFTFTNLKIVKFRRNILARLRSKASRLLFRLGEPIFIMVIMSIAAVFLPSLFPCSPYVCIRDGSNISTNCFNSTYNRLRVEYDVEEYTCPAGIVEPRDNYIWTNRTYNQFAMLIFGPTENAIHQLFSRVTHLQLGFAPLGIMFIFYFFMAAWAAGTSISSGILVPMLFIGGLYGRFVGKILVSIFGVFTAEDSYWRWIDPGAFALVGAASFFGGVSRLTVSLAVIMIEMTNDVQFLLPIITSIMIAKWVGDFFTHPYYVALIEFKCIPYLETEPIVNCKGKRVNLELHSAADIMSHPPVVIHLHENVIYLADLLLTTNHGGFPVVRKSNIGEEVFFGFISRLQLTVLLKDSNLFQRLSNIGVQSVPEIPHEQLTLDKLENPQLIEAMLFGYAQSEEYKDLFINLEPYVNQSAFSVQDKFSLHRTYLTFRTMGLRHMTVVDENNHVIGVITRKDLMGFNIEEKLTAKLDSNQALEDLIAL